MDNGCAECGSVMVRADVFAQIRAAVWTEAAAWSSNTGLNAAAVEFARRACIEVKEPRSLEDPYKRERDRLEVDVAECRKNLDRAGRELEIVMQYCRECNDWASRFREWARDCAALLGPGNDVSAVQWANARDALVRRAQNLGLCDE